jgi:N-methylhydantoinase A/oxoprolinase/acetone carboxylase beta subunit
VDIGGTFTDIVLLDRRSGNYVVHKLLTSTADPSESVLLGISEILQSAGVGIDQLDYVVHGTTLTANTIIQRQGAAAALLVTAGFEDIIEMRNEQRYDVYDLFSEFPEPLVPAALRIPVEERMLSDGQALVALDEEKLRGQLRPLQDGKVQAVAICFLHAYANPEHEQLAKRVVEEELPDVAVSVSAEIVPHAGEYERLSTTVANAYVQPIMGNYLARLEQGLRGLGCRGNLYLMLSDGGMSTIDTARQFPVRLFESGPAAGITATARLREDAESRHLVAFDMGGTTAKICVIDGGQPLTTWDLEVARAHRFRRGSGLPLRIPSIEMVEIGAGGGSLAQVNELGLLKVGPTSTGSTPGPACYGRGGTRPTVTDALLVLGYLNPGYFLGGRLSLDRAKAESAIAREVARPLGLTVEEAALGIYRIACGQMAEAMRVHLAERGKDPRRYSLVAFGGAGPVHACEVARALKIPRVIVPPSAGIMSAGGLLMAPLAFSMLQSYPHPLAKVDATDLNDRFAELATQAKQVLVDAGVDESGMSVEWSLDLKYSGQKHTIEVPLRDQRFDAEATTAIVEDFERLYAMVHGRANKSLDIFAQAIKVRVAGPVADSGWLAQRTISREHGNAADRRQVRFLGQPAGISCPVLHRADLRPGEFEQGPVVVEEPETTTIVGPDDRIGLDSRGNLVIEIGRGTPSKAVGKETNGVVAFAH